MCKLYSKASAQADQTPADADNNSTTENALVRYTWSLGLATWVIAGVGILSFGAALLHWNALRNTDNATHDLAVAASKQAEAADKQVNVMQGQLIEIKKQRELTIAQLRANFKREDFTIVSMNMSGGIAKDGEAIAGWGITPHWTNVGSTNAIDFRSWHATQVLSSFVGAMIQNTQRCPPLAKPSPLANPIIVAQGGPLAERTDMISIEDVIATKGGTKMILIEGHIEWHDVFPDTPLHFDDWCIDFYPNDIDQKIVSPINISETVDRQ